MAGVNSGVVELAGLAEARRQRDAADLTGLLVVQQARAGQVAAGDALHRDHVELAHHQRAAEHLVGDARVVGRAGQVVGRLDVVEEEHAHRGQDAALVRDLAVEDVVERRDAVAGDEQQVVVVDAVQLANLAAGQMLVVGQSGAHRVSLAGHLCCLGTSGSSNRRIETGEQDVIVSLSVQFRSVCRMPPLRLPCTSGVFAGNASGMALKVSAPGCGWAHRVPAQGAAGADRGRARPADRGHGRHTRSTAPVCAGGAAATPVQAVRAIAGGPEHVGRAGVVSTVEFRASVGYVSESTVHRYIDHPWDAVHIVRRAYVFRLRPTARQHVALAACVEGHRELYNAALQERRDGWAHSKTRIHYGDQSAQLTEIRPARPD